MRFSRKLRVVVYAIACLAGCSGGSGEDVGAGNLPPSRDDLTGDLRRVRAPVFSPDGGTYPGAQSVSISAQTSGTICWTSDDSTPTVDVATGTCSNGNAYTSPVDVSASVTLRAIVVAGRWTSAVATASYVIQPAPTPTSTATPTPTPSPSPSPTPAPTTTTTLAQNAYYVSHAGSDVTTCGASGAPCRTIPYALTHAKSGGALGAGDTLYIRGGSAPDTNTACASDGDQGGACWVQPRLNWNGSLPAGSATAQLTVACYPGETCILEGTTTPGDYSGRTIHMQANTVGARAPECSYITFDSLIIDGRRAVNPGPDSASQSPNVPFVVDRSTAIYNAGDPYVDFCHDVVVQNSKVRHGYNVACVMHYSYRFTFLNDEVYECGYYGDFDHAYYMNGRENVVRGGRVHHTTGIQIQNVSSPYAGYHTFDGVEIDHNGNNAFWPQVTLTNPYPGTLGGTASASGAIVAWPIDGNGVTIKNCNIHENTSTQNDYYSGYGISLGLNESAGNGTQNATVINNHIWGNQNQTDYQGRCASGVYVGGAESLSTLTCSGNVATTP